MLKRKKDHGRAEALLIAAYGHMAAHARTGYGGGGGGGGEGGSDEPDPLCTRIRNMVTAAAAAAASGEGTAGGDRGAAGAAGVAGGDTSLQLPWWLGPENPLPYFGPYFGMTG